MAQGQHYLLSQNGLGNPTSLTLKYPKPHVTQPLGSALRMDLGTCSNGMWKGRGMGGSRDEGLAAILAALSHSFTDIASSKQQVLT